MREHLIARQRRRELLITLAYTVFSVLMIIVTAIEQWPVFYVPLIALEMAFVWWSYIQGFRSYQFRAFVVTSMTCLNIFLYGVQGENFQVLIPTLCIEFVLLSLYEITRILDIVIFEVIALFLYHAFVKKSFIIPDGSLERNRMMLQLVSLAALIILCIYRVRHHIQEERDVLVLEDQAQREQKIKDDFVANTSHELRTPVNTISGMCEILLQKILPDDVHRGVLDIQMTGVELQNIITDIMDYSALEADTLELSPREYNITSTLNDVMNMTVFENRDKQLEIIFDCDPNIPCLLEGDEHQLRRVLNDLISNAIKFTSEGGVTVRITHRKEEYGINLIVSVKDTGVGMNLDEQEHILRGFYQTDSDRNRRSAGMGLGLTISSALIKKMGGFLTIKSKEGKGSEFAFAVPQKVVNSQPCISLLHPGSISLLWYYNTQSTVPSMRDAFVSHIRHFSDYFGLFSQQAVSLEECKRRVSQGSGIHLILGQKEYLEDKNYFDALSDTVPIILIADHNEVISSAPRIHVLHKPYNAIMLAEILNGREQTISSRKKEQKRFIAPTARILVVDDNLMNLKVVEGLLRKYRIKIVTASSGEEALSLIESKDYDFVFMDHMMPGMDGVECFHRIRDKQGHYYAHVPVIALTANAIAGSREMFLEEGFSEFIAKPIDTAMLNEMLRQFIPLEKQIFEDDFTGEPAEEPEEDIFEEQEAAEVTGPVDPENVFDALPGIDKETAIMYCGSAEDFMELAEVYCDSGKTYARDLQSAFDGEDLKCYALLSHTIKSTSKTLGAIHLSELALSQETAAKEGLEEIVNQAHENFISEYRGILDSLSAALGKGGTPKKIKKASAGMREIENWGELREELEQCLASYETRVFEECLGKMKGQTLGGRPLDEVLSGVLKKAQGFDFDGAIAELKGIGGTA